MILMREIQIKLILITIVIYAVDILSYSTKLNHAKNGKTMLSNSLFNIISLVGRTANMFQAPLLGAMIDYSIRSKYNPVYEMRNVIFSATIGCLVGIVLIPTFVQVFEKAVARLEKAGSVPMLFLQAMSIASIKQVAKHTQGPTKSMLKRLRFKNIPKRLLLLNVLISGIHTIGVIAAFYAAVYVPEKRLAVSASSGMINGVATVLFTVFVDPSASIIFEEVKSGKRPYGDAKALVAFMVGTILFGTLLGQAFLIPAAKIIAYVYR
jgi:hypothetical protein